MYELRMIRVSELKRKDFKHIAEVLHRREYPKMCTWKRRQCYNKAARALLDLRGDWQQLYRLHSDIRAHIKVIEYNGRGR